jgi:hypothetical protein
VLPGIGVASDSSVTYTVIDPPLKRFRKADNRNEQRSRTRLRTGKITSLINRFIVECQLHDRSPTGARIRLMANVQSRR